MKYLILFTTLIGLCSCNCYIDPKELTKDMSIPDDWYETIQSLANDYNKTTYILNHE